MKPRRKGEAIRERSRGAVLLARTGKTTIAIAKVADVTDEAVHYWMTGKTKPAAAKRGVLERKLGIPVEAWDEHPEPKRSVQTSARPPAPPPSAPSVPEVERESPPASGREGTLVLADELERWARDVMDRVRSDEHSTPLEEAKVIQSLSTSLTTILRSRGESPMTKKKWLASVEFKDIVDAVVGAIAGCPRCSGACAEVLERLNADAAA